jgi:hypothetical protein
MIHHILASQKDIFFDEASCIQFALDNGILYPRPQCRNCRRQTHEERFWVCNNIACKGKQSIFKDSVFGNRRILCCEIMLMARLWISKNSVDSIQDLTGHSKGTVVGYVQQFRKLVTDAIRETQQPIGGNDIVVEVDETKLGKRKFHRGHYVEGVWIVGGVERTPERRMFAERVADRSAETLLEVLRRNILPGSRIISDCWRGYLGIDESLGVEHQTVNHRRHFVDPVTHAHTNTMEGTWHGLKLGIRERSRHEGQVENQIGEFIWRRQNKNNEWNAFIDILRHTTFC